MEGVFLIRKVLGLLILALFILVCSACAAKKPLDENIREKYKNEPTISLYVKETGNVKEVNMEEYLMGVVAAEMEPTWPENALAAQAILARTYTLKKIEDGGVLKRGTDASTDIEEFQAYDPSRINQNVVNAVKKTRGQVVIHNGKLINAWFHADGGGKTAANAVEGLDYNKEATPYIKSVKDPGFKITKPENKYWTAVFPLHVVRERIKNYTGSDPGKIANISILERGPSGRITKVQVNNITLSGPTLRLALGSEEMRSTLVDNIKIEGDKVVIIGKGFGHGVGMSQWGAKRLADQGKSPEKIVEYFFKDVHVVKLWE